MVARRQVDNFCFQPLGSQQLWRMPALGGTARQLTRKGGAVSRESPDGRSIYYVRHEQPGLWRMPWEGGPETLVLDRVYSELYRAWAIGVQGIYYTFQSGSPPTWSIRLVTPENGAERKLATFDKPLPRWSGTLAISPDERWMLLPIWQVQASSLLLFPEVHI